MRPLDLAVQLDRVQPMPINGAMGGWFSQMDCEVRKLVPAYPQLSPAQAAFTDARVSIGYGDGPTKASWLTMKWAASELAVVLRSLGDIEIARCELPVRRSNSPCGYALLSDGTCPCKLWASWHIKS